MWKGWGGVGVGGFRMVGLWHFVNRSLCGWPGPLCARWKMKHSPHTHYRTPSKQKTKCRSGALRHEWIQTVACHQEKQIESAEACQCFRYSGTLWRVQFYFFKYISVSCHLYRVTSQGQNRPKQAKTHGNVLLPFNRNCVFSGELIVSKIQGKCDVSIGIPLVFGKFWQLQSEILHNRFVTRLYSRLLQANKSLILR